jgi:hypothetical protein
LIGALAVAAALWLRCGPGWGLGSWGLGGAGSGSGSGSATAAKRCALRVTATGIFVDGARHTRDEAVAACKTTGADVVITGDAREGDWKDLDAALHAAAVDVVVHHR